MRSRACGRTNPHRKVKTTVLFKAPGYPMLFPSLLKASGVAAEDLTSQVLSGTAVPKDRDEAAWLVDWKAMLKTV